MSHRRAQRLFALLAGAWVAGCSPGGGYGCDASASTEAGPNASLALGERTAGSFVALVDGGSGTLVQGSQGGWMLLLVVHLPADWADAACVVLSIQARLSPSARTIDPIVIGLRPSPDGAAVALGPVPVLLGFDPFELTGQAVAIMAVATSDRGRASESLTVTLRR